jgi:hypothetical protein
MKNKDPFEIARNYNVKPPKLGGGMGKKAPAIISTALGTAKGLPVHRSSVARLVSHPDPSVAKAAKKMLGKF